MKMVILPLYGCDVAQYASLPLPEEVVENGDYVLTFVGFPEKRFRTYCTGLLATVENGVPVPMEQNPRAIGLHYGTEGDRNES